MSFSSCIKYRVIVSAKREREREVDGEKQEEELDEKVNRYVKSRLTVARLKNVMLPKRTD